ncbi:mannose-1-phosphate guanylyltransferase/mannose-6-phosphate isomerase [Thermodesulfobium narugense DSM 14796]|uniref:mannose-1-phosphate guanylyltransferase n=1 Tax=Thermodesulfobium narugense DSM 14796 TaxID=747365 RepID=M1E616_9BACT|nr:mannose-1-phosphate guanylyltransferase/mannose-6-phosphate isomerase [Thermodesulfobium narugense]AEE13948.1 mannose-1-phosphate guanylyltransferase/mannose-6-phosphate isomerase [Thermodesulfobium narugense DSM 14796]
MKVAVLAGGVGSRLWPLSRERYPKQLISLTGDKSLLQNTIDRLLPLCDNHILIVGIDAHKEDLEWQLSSNGDSRIKYNILLEPYPRNTYAACLYLTLYLEKQGVKDPILVVPADHMILNEELFYEVAKDAEKLAEKGYIVTFGIKPSFASTGFGYILKGERIDGSKGFRISKFEEKPSLERAKMYIQNENYLWNSGMFMWKPEVFLSEVKRLDFETYEKVRSLFDDKFERDPEKIYSSLPSIPVDKAVMEKSNLGAVIPSGFEWSDLGSWDSLYDVAKKNKDGNVTTGDVLALHCRNSFMYSTGKLMVGIDLEDLIVVDADDAILVCKRGSSQYVKDAFDALKEQGREESQIHRTVYRFWGQKTLISRGDNFLIYQVLLLPKKEILLQMHHHRSENWIILSGAVEIEKDGKKGFYHRGDSILIPKSTPHKISNPGKISAQILEIWQGEYLEEDDVEYL